MAERLATAVFFVDLTYQLALSDQVQVQATSSFGQNHSAVPTVLAAATCIAIARTALCASSTTMGSKQIVQQPAPSVQSECEISIFSSEHAQH
jgi:hypothetical protein